MIPEVYMCYLINVKHGNFKRLVRQWNNELKTYDNTIKFRTMKNKVQEVRKKQDTKDWSNFSVERLLSFINSHIYFGKDGQ